MHCKTDIQMKSVITIGFNNTIVTIVITINQPIVSNHYSGNWGLGQ